MKSKYLYQLADEILEPYSTSQYPPSLKLFLTTAILLTVNEWGFHNCMSFSNSLLSNLQAEVQHHSVYWTYHKQAMPYCTLLSEQT